MSLVPAQRRGRPGWIGPGLFLLVLLFPAAAGAQNQLRWTTNYYKVTGLTSREVRRSINQARPWRNRSESDAVTVWSVTWNYEVVTDPQGCRPENIRTTTTITTTLPLLIPPTNAPPELLRQWARYFTALTRHEAQHAAMATSAASDIQAGLASAGERRDCVTLQGDLNAMAGAMVERRRRDEREMDRRTSHGAEDGARFP